MTRGAKKFYPYTFTYPALLIYAVFFIIPTLCGFYFSFTNWNIELEKINFVGLENFGYLFQNEYFQLALRNTVIFALVTSVLKVGFGFLLALATNRNFISKNYLRTVFYMPGVLSIIVVGIMFSSIFRMEGMLNNFIHLLGAKNWTIDWLGNPKTALGCVMSLEIWKWSGLCMAIFLAGLQTIPKELYESAAIDGASAWRRLRHITVPMIMPAFTINIVINLIGGFKVFEPVFVLTSGGPGHMTQVLNTMVFQAFSEGTYGRGTAMGMILFLLTAVISISVVKVLRKKEVEI